MDRITAHVFSTTPVTLGSTDMKSPQEEQLRAAVQERKTEGGEQGQEECRNLGSQLHCLRHRTVWVGKDL